MAKWTVSSLMLISYMVATTSSLTIEQAASTANNKFSFELGAQLVGNPMQNTFFSAFNIDTALAMVYLGAGGNTAKQMSNVLYFNTIEAAKPSDGYAVHEAYKSLLAEYNTPNSNYSLSAANNIYPAKKFSMLKTYTTNIQKYYDVQIVQQDFCDDAATSASTINAWVANQTNDKITDLFSAGDFNCETRLVLVSAIYFKGKWKTMFKTADTQLQTFYKASTSGETVQANMMSITSTFSFMQSDTLKMVELPYTGDTISMFVILPNDNNGITTLNVTSETFATMQGQMYNQDKLLVKLPKFTIETKYPNMVTTLQNMGINDLFSASCNLSGIDGKLDLAVDQIIHQAYVQVDEQGTEAAAATGIVVGAMDAMDPPPPPPEFIADHPFMFVLVHKTSSNILFQGIVMDPTVKT